MAEGSIQKQDKRYKVLLAIPDDASLAADELKALPVEIITAETGDEALKKMTPDVAVIVTGVSFEDMEVDHFLRLAQEVNPLFKAVLFTNERDAPTILSLLSRATFWSYHFWPDDDFAHSVGVILSLRSEDQKLIGQGGLTPADRGFFNMVGTTDVMQRVYERIKLLAPRRSTILVTGESGVGKELVARALHAHSGRWSEPFVAINVAAITPTLAESILFGHARGSFTGAGAEHKGVFLEAKNGTLLLDEIGELDLHMQGKFLRAVEERQVRPVGADKEHPVDARIIVATHRNLWESVKRRRLRKDLFFRLSGIEIRVPPLRERREDIPALAEFFLAKVAKENDLPIPTVSPKAMKALKAYPWPGNVRELARTLEGATFSLKEVLDANDIDPLLRKDARTLVGSTFEFPTLAEAEWQCIQDMLDHTDDSVEETARLLNVSEEALRRKIARYRRMRQ